MRLSPKAIRLGERSELRSSRKAPRRGRSPSAEQPCSKCLFGRSARSGAFGPTCSLGSAFRRSPAKQALRGRKLGFALVLTNCPANTRGNSGNNWRVRHTISRPFFFAAVGVSRARLARLAKNRRVEIGSLLRYCRRSSRRRIRLPLPTLQWDANGIIGTGYWYWIFSHLHIFIVGPMHHSA